VHCFLKNTTPGDNIWITVTEAKKVTTWTKIIYEQIFTYYHFSKT